MDGFTSAIAAQIWDMKYRFKDGDGAAIDTDLSASWHRVAQSLASVEKEPAKWEGPFYEALVDFKFLPAGRILAGAGTKRSVTLFNCFVMGTILDRSAKRGRRDGRCGRRFRSFVIYGCLGRDVPHDYVCRQPTGCHDGNHAVRSSRH
jgi:hypothetical protein